MRGKDSGLPAPSANVLKASEDKTFPGAIVASLGSPWGQAITAGDAPGGKPVYFGSYREIFARDLYESFSGLIASGDLATARRSCGGSSAGSSRPDGRFPRNSMLNGRKAPDSGGDQLDESAYPILMAQQAGLDRDRTLYTDHIRAAADFLVAHGPSFGSERWEEQGGTRPRRSRRRSPGLVAAGVDRRPQRRPGARPRLPGDRRPLPAQHQGLDGHLDRPVRRGRYFLRLTKNGDPDSE